MVLVSRKQETSKGFAGRRRNSFYFPNWVVTDSCPLKTWTTIITSKRGTWLPSFSVFKVRPRTLGGLPSEHMMVDCTSLGCQRKGLWQSLCAAGHEQHDYVPIQQTW